MAKKPAPKPKKPDVIKDGKAYYKKTRTVAVKPTDRLSGGTKVGEKYNSWDQSPGFKKPDLGKERGPGTPYRAVQKSVQGRKENYLEQIKGWKPPKPKPKPKPKTQSSHFTVQAKRGDTLSGISSRYGQNWKDVWNYNLKNRKSSTVKKMKSRGPNLIYKGSRFYIPKNNSRVNAIRRRLG